jgi:hypothetical protein
MGSEREDVINLDFQKLWAMLTDCWQIKTVVSGTITAFTFLVGEVNGPLVALAVLVIFDTFTRWCAIGKKTLAAHNEEGSIWYGIYRALHFKDINSCEMRGKFQTKVLGYLILLIGFNLLSKIIPQTFFDTDISRAPTVFISSWLAFAELQSIIENLIDCGMDALRPLAIFVSKKRQAMTGEATPPQQQKVGEP